MNKVEYGLKNIHIAFLDKTVTPNQTTMPAWEEPIAVPGAFQFSLAPAGSANNFYGDDGIWFTASAGNNQTGTLQTWFPSPAIKARMLGDYIDDEGKYIQTARTGETFAILGELTGDETNTRFVFYSCTAARGEFTYDTTPDVPTPTPNSMPITASSMYFQPLGVSASGARVSADKAAIYNDFFDEVVPPSAPATP